MDTCAVESSGLAAHWAAFCFLHSIHSIASNNTNEPSKSIALLWWLNGLRICFVWHVKAVRTCVLLSICTCVNKYLVYRPTRVPTTIFTFQRELYSFVVCARMRATDYWPPYFLFNFYWIYAVAAVVVVVFVSFLFLSLGRLILFLWSDNLY